MKLCWLGLVAAGLALGADEPKSQAEKDQEMLQGAWRATHVESDSVPAPAKEIAKWRIVFLGDTVMTMQGDKIVSEGYFRLDPSQNPPMIDVSPTRVPDRDKVARGIYAIDGDKLRLALSAIGEERPAEFKSPPGTDHVVFILRRAPR